jgi:hypothetical protein
LFFADWKVEAALLSFGGAGGTSVSSGGLADVGVGVLLTVEPTTVMLVGDSAVDEGSRVWDEGTSELSIEASGTL